MELSVFLAKFFGIYLLVVGLLWAIRANQLSEIIKGFFNDRGLIFMSGLLALAVGIAMAISHSVWELSWRGVITLFGYMSILKGIVRTGFPNLPKRSAEALTKGPGRWVWIAVALLLGAWLTWKGFSAA